MASASVLKMDGTEVGSVELSPEVFETPMNPTVVKEVIVGLRNAKRQGNAETKTRKDVRGGGAKPYRQKGTGNARRGSTREPHLRGGGTVFGPHRRSYRQGLSAALRRQAIRCLLSDRAQEGAIAVLDELQFDSPKTRQFADMTAKIAPESRRTLVITAEPNRNAVLSARNLPRVYMSTADDLNALDLADVTRVVIEKEALPKLESRLAKRVKVKETEQ